MLNFQPRKQSAQKVTSLYRLSLNLLFQMQEIAVCSRTVFTSLFLLTAFSKLLLYSAFGAAVSADVWNTLILCYFLKKDKTGLGMSVPIHFNI